MKQSIEEVAYDYATQKTKFRKEVLKEVDADNYVSRHADCMEDFQCGYNYCMGQSPWHEVSEEPKKGEHICVQVGSGNLTSWFATSNIRKDFEDYNVIRWAYVSDLIKTKTFKLWECILGLPVKSVTRRQRKMEWTKK